MTNGTAPPHNYTRGPAMTIRVYKVTREGTVTEECGTVHVPPSSGPLPLSTAFPPCCCPDCQKTRAVTR
ncbi:hypothetical protein [Streptomyces sp. NPDC101165]|uniref:hypothetical protein n=1 Tax=Streptomyces sp. NPDC101165 TaxID=3366119 RepID=UPI00381730D8